mmetsp:Transcript_16859/g.35558  ORF Transcript_16859/g.35558 Transcript_16859/m.35558 type:complete len:235 (-) Transcript_16859:549-1253(-)
MRRAKSNLKWESSSRSLSSPLCAKTTSGASPLLLLHLFVRCLLLQCQGDQWAIRATEGPLRRMATAGTRLVTDIRRLTATLRGTEGTQVDMDTLWLRRKCTWRATGSRWITLLGRLLTITPASPETTTLLLPRPGWPSNSCSRLHKEQERLKLPRLAHHSLHRLASRGWHLVLECTWLHRHQPTRRTRPWLRLRQPAYHTHRCLHHSLPWLRLHLSTKHSPLSLRRTHPWLRLH